MVVLPALVGFLIGLALDGAVLLVGALPLRTRRAAGLWLVGAGVAGIGAMLGVGGVGVASALFGFGSPAPALAVAPAAALQAVQVVAFVMAHRRLAHRVSP